MSIAERLTPYVPPVDEEYDRSRDAWRRSLSDVDVRSMAYEYRIAEAGIAKGRGFPDECLCDAWEEYQKRFGNRKPQTEFLNRPDAIKTRRRKKA